MNNQKGEMKMDIEKMTVEQLKAAAAKCEKLENEKRTGEKFQCVILSDRFIYVGWVKRTKARVYIRDAKNVRYWSGNGLGPSLQHGFKDGSKVDACGDVVVEKSALRHTIDANPAAFK